MFRKLSLITAVAGLALLSAVPAFAKGTPVVSEQWQEALVVRGEAMNRQHGLGDSTQIATRASFERALTLRGQELNRQHELGTFGPTSTYLDANERAARVNGIALTTTPDAFERAVETRVNGTQPTTVISGDDHVRIDPADLPTVVTASSSSGSELEWPQVGIGFGIGIVLMLGIALTLRYSGTRPLAH